MAERSLSALAREPLVHFLVVGAALAAIDHFVHQPTEDERVIVVDERVRRELADAFLHETGAEPTPADLAPRVERWVDDEVLYREGIVRGLDRDDPRVRERVASRMAALLDAEHAVADPTDDELRAWFEAHADRWAEDARIDFVHVFVDGSDAEAEARAEALRAELVTGGSRVGLGDTFSGGRTYRGRRIADLTETFGDAFTDGLDAQPVDVWTVRRSRFGFHVVRVERRTAASAPDFETARLDVERDYLEHAHAERTDRAVEALRARWEIVER